LLKSYLCVLIKNAFDPFTTAMTQQHILTEVFEKINQYLQENKQANTAVVNFVEPHQLAQSSSLKIQSESSSAEDFLSLLDQYLHYSVRTGNRQFHNQLFSGFNFPAFVGEILTALTNTSMYTYEVAPLASLMEMELIKLMGSLAGYTQCDGTFLTGGSNANLIAMLSARNHLFPDLKNKGYFGKGKLTAFVNEQAHYSLETAANLLGIGSENLIKVKTDFQGRMIPSELEKAIQQSIQRNETPFFVTATCATTVLAAYDPIDEIAEITKKYGLWLHADGAFGGSALLSPKHKHLLQGLEKTDSFAWDAHKLMGIPLICSVLLTKKPGILQNNITDIDTDYIYHDSDEIEDLGKKSIQCGRRADAVKLWFAWKYFGMDGYAKRIDNLIDMASYCEAIVKKHPSLELQRPRQSFSVCFRYVPLLPTNLNDFNRQLRENLRKKGIAMVNYSHFGKDLTIRLVISNADVNQKDMDVFFQNLIAEAQALESKLSL